MKLKLVLPIIVISQFMCTSLWFAGNAVLSDLVFLYGLPVESIGHITASVQLGFIVGTLVYALFTISDKFSPVSVFFISACLGALFNTGIVWVSFSLEGLVLFRFIVGFFLAGIYPVGMKIASDYYEKGLGKALGYLVGALVLGTALPHLVANVSSGFSWKLVMVCTSIFAFLGGMLMLLLGDGPYRKRGNRIDISVAFKVFKDRSFRSPALGYFGHMWELYAFWAFIPIVLTSFNSVSGSNINVSLWSFFIIGVGFLSCVLGGHLSLKFGSRATAFVSLLLSMICCFISPLLMAFGPIFLLLFLVIWGAVVISDSPQFSTLVAKYAPEDYRGTALTIVNCIGFAITIVSIELVNYMSTVWSVEKALIVLAAGPLLGLFGLGIKRGSLE